jgi:hypothetical protein
VRRHAFLGLAGGAALFRVSWATAKRLSDDAAGKSICRRSEHLPPGPPAALILFMVAPEKMLAGRGLSTSRLHAIG